MLKSYTPRDHAPIFITLVLVPCLMVLLANSGRAVVELIHVEFG